MAKKLLPYLVSLLLLIFITKTLLPSLSLPFSLIDDPDFAQKYSAVTQGLKNGGLSEGVQKFFTVFPGTEQGRLTPTFWSIFITRFFVAGLNPQAHHLFYSLEILLIFSLLFVVVKNLTKNKTIALLSCLFLLLLSPGSENWYRISTQEPGQILTLLLLILSALKSKKFNWSIIIFSILFLFSKEVSFLLTPLFFIWWLFEENKKEKKKLFKSWTWMAGLSLLFLITLWQLNKNNIWAGNNASLANIIPSLKTYWQILWKLYVPQVLAVSIPLILWLGKNKKLRKTGYIFLAWVLLDFLALLPWKYSLARLTGTMMVGVAVVLAMATYLISEKTIQVLKKRKIKDLLFLPVTTVFLLLIVKFAYVNFLDGYNFRQTYLAWEKSNGSFLEEVSKMPEGAQIIVNVSEGHLNAHEWIVMMPEHLDIFYNRKDITVNFVDEEDLEKEKINYLAQWSVYNLPLESTEGELIWQTEEKANLISVSLTQVFKKVLGLNDLSITQEKIYSWQIYQN